MRWCNDVNNKKNYNKLIHNNKLRSEKIYRKDYKYNLFIVINYNFYKKIPGKGSAIFLHMYTYMCTCVFQVFSNSHFRVKIAYVSGNALLWELAES